MGFLKRSLATAFFALGIHGVARAELNFNLNNGAGLTALQTTDGVLYTKVRNGFTTAASIWSSRFSDSVTVNINIDYIPLGQGILGQAGSTTGVVSYTNFRNSLIADATSATDVQATNSLPTGSSFQTRTSDRNGFVDLDNNASANNQLLEITSANAKALGLLTGNDPIVDAAISFSSNFSFDFDRSDGIDFNAYDFIGVAVHEIGHALGFISGVDTVDFYTGNGSGSAIDINDAADGIGSLEDFAIFNSLDLFRYSTDSITLAPGTLDGAAGGAPYFSLDKGVTNLGLFSTGSENGDGRQASHWKDNLGLGILDPTSANGELLTISDLDIQAFDAIGWDVVAVPEPATLLLISVGLAGIRFTSRSFRSKAKFAS